MRKTDRVTKPPFVLLETDQLYLDRLDHRFVMPLKLAHQGIGYDKVAEALHVPIGSVKSRIHRARGAIERMRKGENPLIASGRTA